MGLNEQFCGLTLNGQAQVQVANALNNLNAFNKCEQIGFETNNSKQQNHTDDEENKTWKIYYQPDEGNNTCLHYACWEGYPVEVLSALLRMAPDPCYYNQRNNNKHTPMHLAAMQLQSLMLRELLLAGANPFERDALGNTPLHVAVQKRDVHGVRALTDPLVAAEIQTAYYQYNNRSMHPSLNLVRAPADFEIANYYGERVVHIAARFGDIEILRILVLHGADINARIDTSGQTPLHIAVAHSNEELVNFLVSECAQLNIETVTYSGLTAYQMAYINCNKRMQQILSNHGAMSTTPPDSETSDTTDDSDMEMETEAGSIKANLS